MLPRRLAPRRLSRAVLALGLALASAAPAAGLDRGSSLEALRGGDVDDRRAAVFWLGRHGTMAEVPDLVEALRDADPMVRRLSERALWAVWGRSGDAAVDRRLEEGTRLMHRGRFAEAHAVFDAVVDAAPAFAEGYNKRATARFHLGRYRDSLADVRRTLERNPYHFGALSGAGLCMLALERPAAALDYFRRALEINPNLEETRRAVERLREALEERML